MAYYKARIQPEKGQLTREIWVPVSAQDTTEACRKINFRCEGTSYMAVEESITLITEQEYMELFKWNKIKKGNSNETPLSRNH
jgi:hypothetical protein